MSVKVDFTLLSVLVLCCFALLLSGCGREDAAYVAEKRKIQKERAFCDKYLPWDIPSEAERASLMEIYRNAARAYSNGQVAARKDIHESFVQLILTIGRTRTFDNVKGQLLIRFQEWRTVVRAVPRTARNRRPRAAAVWGKSRWKG